MSIHTKCLIIGSGPAGYTAGIYASRSGLNPIIIEGMQPGGQLTITADVENFPGYPNGSTGPLIMDDFRQQALNLNVKLVCGMVTSVNFSNQPFSCIVNNEVEYLADTVIIATGATAKWLNINGETQYRGFGVSACATCDGAFFVDKDVAVIGGGNSAVEEAIYLAKRCKKVFLVHRRDKLRAVAFLQDIVLNSPNIFLIWNSVPIEIIGEKKGFIKEVTGLKVKNTNDNSESIISINGVFVSIGTKPVSDIFANQINLDKEGYIITQPGTPFTNISGIFAAGDVQNANYRQAVTAAASGCIAAIEADRYLSIMRKKL